MAPRQQRLNDEQESTLVMIYYNGPTTVAEIANLLHWLKHYRPVDRYTCADCHEVMGAFSCPACSGIRTLA